MEVWKKLYELSDQLMYLRPWEDFWSSDFIRVQFLPDEFYYCTIMGKEGTCIGISVYNGDDGYADLCSISQDYEDQALIQYIMYEQNCLTWYVGDSQEVPREQKKIIKDLGLKYRGRNAWPYFLSFEKQYYPWPINEEEAKVLAKVLEKILDISKAYREEGIAVDYDNGEMIFAKEVKGKWEYVAEVRPEMIDKFEPVELCDEDIFNELEKSKLTKKGLIIDLAYLNTYIEDKKFKKPINALMFIVVDEKSQMIIHGNLLSPEDDEIGEVINFFVNYILHDGLPEAVYIRNPMVYAAIVDICERYGIELVMTNLPMIDSILDDMKTRM